MEWGSFEIEKIEKRREESEMGGERVKGEERTYQERAGEHTLLKWQGYVRRRRWEQEARELEFRRRDGMGGVRILLPNRYLCCCEPGG